MLIAQLSESKEVRPSFPSICKLTHSNSRGCLTAFIERSTRRCLTIAWPHLPSNPCSSIFSSDLSKSTVQRLGWRRSRSGSCRPYHPTKRHLSSVLCICLAGLVTRFFLVLVGSARHRAHLATTGLDPHAATHPHAEVAHQSRRAARFARP